jgi:hypothetical protein
MLRFVYLLILVLLLGEESFLFVRYFFLYVVLYLVVSFGVYLSLLDEPLEGRPEGREVDILRITIAVALYRFSDSRLILKVLVLLPHKILQTLIDKPIDPVVLLVN